MQFSAVLPLSKQTPGSKNNALAFAGFIGDDKESKLVKIDDEILAMSDKQLAKLSDHEKLRLLLRLTFADKCTGQTRQQCLRKLYSKLSFSKARSDAYKAATKEFADKNLGSCILMAGRWSKMTADEKLEAAKRLHASQMQAFRSNGNLSKDQITDAEIFLETKQSSKNAMTYKREMERGEDGKEAYTNKLVIYNVDKMSFEVFIFNLFMSGLFHLNHKTIDNIKNNDVVKSVQGQEQLDSDKALLFLSMFDKNYVFDEDDKEKINPTSREASALEDYFIKNLKLRSYVVNVKDQN